MWFIILIAFFELSGNTGKYVKNLALPYVCTLWVLLVMYLHIEASYAGFLCVTFTKTNHYDLEVIFF